MGLLGGIARTAVAAGTWTAVSNRVSRRQANRWAQEDQSAYPAPAYQAPPPPPQPAPAAATGNDIAGQLARLGQLHDSGVLTDEEFAKSKAKLLGV
jgi:hypothetical protein